MRETYPPPNQSGSSKLIVLFLVGGIAMLALAGVVLYKRRSQDPPPPPSSPSAMAALDVAAPLVASQPTRRPILEEADTATEENADETKKKAKHSAKAKREKVGSIDTKEVNRFMNARFSQVKACYERRLKKNSFLEGKVDLNIDVASSGKVTRVSVNKDTVGDSEMIACVKRTIRAWEFPKPEGGRVIIGKTFNFKKKT